MNTEVVYTRRGFVKMAAGTVAAAALVAAGAESIDFSKAFAATGDTVSVADMVVGQEYTASVNLYVKAKFNLFLGIDAYLTNLTTPNILTGKLPNTKVEDNATIIKTGVDASGNPTFQIVIPELNDTFGLTSIAETGDPSTAKVTGKTWVNPWIDACEQRVETITFEVTGETSGQEFTASEYANYMGKGAVSWPVTLMVDYTSIKEK